MRDGKTPGKQPEQDISPLALAGLGTQFAVALIAFALAGQWLDSRLGTSPAFLLIGVFLGGGGTFYTSYKRLMKQTPAPGETGRDRGTTGEHAPTRRDSNGGGEE